MRHAAVPTLTSYDCRPYLASSDEICIINNIEPGTYHVMVRAFSSFSGVTIAASYQAGLSNGVTVAFARAIRRPRRPGRE